ncbi:Acg family FMN-binding oxidoreductase [Mycolicibacter hiberniae]|uniref:Putative NAD(P)H nitroreductase acg n=1 Tax=Mycolicibacter hiberniae TaxID=29314 RepID=A0A7I7WYV3_9MYCO|nr:NAD(P)H nitroreductase [Mycolicibacter hiberniae]MCV7086743.1 NAD(P)H nitroreductase [Mycolicibacter hiberniae]ORV66732.1 NAD(P)H nitroreductase [Mycolicibacter hiberniae]BBZ22330.1 putative NAD(P)H nitroreductase acg [Mycolicibacter hiberniae]
MLNTSVDSDVLTEAVRLACRAPSLHNSQPWRWVAQAGRLDLFLDSNRAVHGDQSAREALISCGAVLDHLRVAMAAAGWTADIERFPDAAQPEHLASIGFTAAAGPVTDLDRYRSGAILARRTDRLPFLEPGNWEPFETVLHGTVSDQVRLYVLDAEARATLAEASELTEALRLYDSAYHAELGWWTAPFEVSDGIPQSALVSAAESDRVDVGRAFPVTHNRERRLQVGEDQSRIVLLSTAGDGPEDALACGEALSQLLLEATMAGLATCPVTHVTEVPAARTMLAGVVGAEGLPQVLVRIGAAPALETPPAPTPRRPLGDVLHRKL